MRDFWKDLVMVLLIAAACVGAMLWAVSKSTAGWGGGSTEPNTPVGDTYAWKVGNRLDQIHLMKNGHQIGTWDRETGFYHEYDRKTETWGPPVDFGKIPTVAFTLPDCPCFVERSKKFLDEHVTNFGVRPREANAPEKCSVNGHRVSKEDLLNAIQAPVNPKDETFLRVTVIGTDAERAKVLEDLARSPLLAFWHDHLVVNSYPPDHWRVKQCGFDPDGKPTVVIQTPDGHKTSQTRGYVDGAVGLRRHLIAFDLTWSVTADPYKDPDPVPDHPADPVVSDTASHVPLCCVALGLLGLYLYTRKEQ